MTTGSPLKSILRFCVPLLIGNLFQQFYNLADSILVGRILGLNAFAAVGTTGALSFLILGFATGSCSGLAIPIAQSFGAGDLEGVRRRTAQLVWLGFGITAIIRLICFFWTDDLLRLMNTPAEIFDDAYRYIFIVFMGVGATMLYNLSSAVLRSLGDSRTPLHFLIAAAVVNVILDILFMKYLHFGVEGAAWATVLSQLASGIACLVYMAKKIPVLNLHHDDMKPDWKRICYMAAIGVPMCLQFAITAVGAIILQGAVNGLGAQAVAAVSAASKVHNVVAAPLETCGIAMATYCGQNLGAGQYARIRRGIWSTTAAAMIYCALAFVFNYSAGRGMATLFVSPSEVMILQDVQKYLVIQSVFYPMLAVIFIFRNGLQGMGYSNQAMMAGVSELIARALVSFGLVGSLGFTAVCYANPAAWLFADGVLLVLYVRVMRRLDPIRPQDLKARKLAKAQR
jgi:putative MATE family efflux protein